MNDVAIFRNINEAVIYCRKRGYHITYPGLVYVIRSHQEIFRRSVIGTYYPKIYVDEIDEYIAASEAKPKDGEITIAEARKEFKLPNNFLYSLIKNGKLSYNRYGRGKGVMYVKRSDAERYGNEYYGNKQKRL